MYCDQGRFFSFFIGMFGLLIFFFFSYFFFYIESTLYTAYWLNKIMKKKVIEYHHDPFLRLCMRYGVIFLFLCIGSFLSQSVFFSSIFILLFGMRLKKIYQDHYDF